MSLKVCSKTISFFFNDPATTEIYTLSLHDALPIFQQHSVADHLACRKRQHHKGRSEEHTSELQSHHDLVCRLRLEKKKREQEQPRLARARVAISISILIL